MTPQMHRHCGMQKIDTPDAWSYANTHSKNKLNLQSLAGRDSSKSTTNLGALDFLRGGGVRKRVAVSMKDIELENHKPSQKRGRRNP